MGGERQQKNCKQVNWKRQNEAKPLNIAMKLKSFFRNITHSCKSLP